jgi:FKBP-type peptidyl-prolyl cis-trans isomerase FkpA
LLNFTQFYYKNKVKLYLADQIFSMINFRPLALVALLFFLVVHCKKDPGPEPIREIDEQTFVDDEALVSYLKTHFYNYEDFENDPDNYKLAITLDTIAEENSDKTPLWNQVKTKTVEITDNNDKKIANKLYYLIVKEGIGDRPTLVDSTYISYQGSLLDGRIFDKKDYPIWFDLTNVVRGFREALPFFSAGDHTANDDGTFDLDHYGQGLIFMPSALGYYAQSLLLIPKYSPLIFSVALHKVNPTDHDLDGIMSIDEDPDGDGNPLNDDTDSDNAANYRDADDDGDGILTQEEYDRNGDGIPDDDDKDGVPDYLDKDND